jgi:hypothetical protein
VQREECAELGPGGGVVDGRGFDEGYVCFGQGSGGFDYQGFARRPSVGAEEVGGLGPGCPAGPAARLAWCGVVPRAAAAWAWFWGGGHLVLLRGVDQGLLRCR